MVAAQDTSTPKGWASAYPDAAFEVITPGNYLDFLTRKQVPVQVGEGMRGARSSPHQFWKGVLSAKIRVMIRPVNRSVRKSLMRTRTPLCLGEGGRTAYRVENGLAPRGRQPARRPYHAGGPVPGNIIR